MTFNDLKNFTCGEIGKLTLGQLQLDKFELLNLVASGKINLPDNVWKKMCEVCGQTIADFNNICPNYQMDIPECITLQTPHQMTPEQIIQIITFIMTVITFFTGITSPQADVSNITINNYCISPKDQETIQHDLDNILDCLPNKEDYLEL